MSERLSRERLEEIRGWMSDDDLDNHGPDGFLFSGTQAVLMLDQCLQHIAALEAENERLRAVVEAARPVIEWAREHWSDGLLTEEDQVRCGEAYRAHTTLAALEGEG